MFVETTLAIPRFLFGNDGGGDTIVNDPSLAPYLLTSDIDLLKGITPVKAQVHGMIFHHIEQLKNPTPFEIRERERLKGIAPDQYEAFSNAEETLRMLDRAGVPILVGTDAANGATAGVLMHAELETVVKAGLSPTDALADATSVPAKIFSLNDRGRIAPGLRADLLLVRGDPTVDISATKDIVAIWKQGVRFDRDAFRESIAQRNEAWRFGRGWWPWSDVQFGGNSKVHVSARVSGPDHAETMSIEGNVKSGIAEPFAGVMFFPVGWGFSPVNYLGVKGNPPIAGAWSHFAEGAISTTSLYILDARDYIRRRGRLAEECLAAETGAALGGAISPEISPGDRRQLCAARLAVDDRLFESSQPARLESGRQIPRHKAEVPTHPARPTARGSPP